MSGRSGVQTLRSKGSSYVNKFSRSHLLVMGKRYPKPESAEDLDGMFRSYIAGVVRNADRKGLLVSLRNWLTLQQGFGNQQQAGQQVKKWIEDNRHLLPDVAGRLA